MAIKETPIFKFFAENVDWDKSERTKLKEQNVGLKQFAFVGWGFAIAAVITVLPLTKLHEVVVVPVTVDRQTGNYETHVGMVKTDIKDKKNENRITADLVTYVKARVGFTRGEASANYRKVWWMTAEGERGAWEHEYKPDLNPDALLNTMKATDKIELKNLSLTFIPNDLDPEQRVAQVRYDKVISKGSAATTIQPFVSVMTFKYDPSSIPTSDLEAIADNPFGFVSVNYRADPQGPKRPYVQQQGDRQ